MAWQESQVFEKLSGVFEIHIEQVTGSDQLYLTGSEYEAAVPAEQYPWQQQQGSQQAIMNPTQISTTK